MLLVEGSVTQAWASFDATIQSQPLIVCRAATRAAAQAVVEHAAKQTAPATATDTIPANASQPRSVYSGNHSHTLTSGTAQSAGFEHSRSHGRSYGAAPDTAQQAMMDALQTQDASGVYLTPGTTQVMITMP